MDHDPEMPSRAEVEENGCDAFSCSPSALKSIGDSLFALNAGCFASCKVDGIQYFTIFYNSVDAQVRLCYVTKNAPLTNPNFFLFGIKI